MEIPKSKTPINHKEVVMGRLSARELDAMFDLGQAQVAERIEAAAYRKKRRIEAEKQATKDFLLGCASKGPSCKLLTTDEGQWWDISLDDFEDPEY
jgi:hypothetical protein